MQVPPSYASYPRGPGGSGGNSDPYYRYPGVHLEAFGDGWRMVKSNIGPWLALAFLLFAVSGVVYAGMFFLVPQTSAPTAGSDPNALIGTMVNLYVTSYAQGFLPGVLIQFFVVVLQNYAVRQAAFGEVGIEEGFVIFRRFGPVLATVILCQLINTVAYLLCFIPGLLTTGLLVLAPLIAANQECSPVEAIKRSVETLKPHLGGMAGFVILTGLVSGAGFIACCFGVIVTIPIAMAAIGLHYHYFFPPFPAPGMNPTGPVAWTEGRLE